MRRTAGGALAVALVAIAVAHASATADPIEDGAAEAEALVRAVYYEGLPPERARALDDAGIARLAELLADPEEAAVHGNALLALGLSGHPHAFPQLASYAANVPHGAVDRDTWRAHTWLPLAMGHLAASDARALEWLLEEAAQPTQPEWHFRHHRGPRLARLLEIQRLHALSWSGAPRAEALLRRAADAARAAGDPVRQRSVRAALDRLERVRHEGAAAVLSAERARRGLR